MIEDSAEAWTHPHSKVTWLKDLLPNDLEVGRIITYNYNASLQSFFSNDAPKEIQRMAESLVQELVANRGIAGTLRRPIIFICHGLGGVIVKKSLMYSSTRTAPKVVHLRDQFISTFGILFFGTPHGKTDPSNWAALGRRAFDLRARRSIFHHAGLTLTRTQVSQSVQGPHLVDQDFAPFIKQFRIFFFWEELPTKLGDHHSIIVDHESAAPKLDNTESSGIHADHPSMVRFGSRQSSDYRTVLAALTTYCKKAPNVVAHRWNQAEISLKQLRAKEACELGQSGVDIDPKKPFCREEIPVSPSCFHPPQALTTNFVGRKDIMRTLSSAFFPNGLLDSERGQKSFVIFGMGGSGKSQLCSQFAHDFKT